MMRENVAWRRLRDTLVYIAILLLLVGPLVLASGYCLVFIIAIGDPSAPAWIPFVFVGLGLVLAALAMRSLIGLNRRIPIRQVLGRLGTFLFWLGWSMPTLLLLWAVAQATVRIVGIEHILPGETSGRSHWHH